MNQNKIKKKSFEQLCINFANESLQLHFNQHIFKLEQEEYKREGINWENIPFIDNQVCIDLISQRPVGLLPLIDEESNFPKATDMTLLEKMEKYHSNHPNFEKPKGAKAKRDIFCIKHYAGMVTYNVNGFLEKNRDTLRYEWMTVLNASKNQFIASLFSLEAEKTDEDEEDYQSKQTLSRKAGGGRRAGSKIPTVGAQFNVRFTNQQKKKKRKK